MEFLIHLGCRLGGRVFPIPEVQKPADAERDGAETLANARAFHLEAAAAPDPVPSLQQP